MKWLKQTFPFLLLVLILGPHVREMTKTPPPPPVVVVAHRAEPVRPKPPTTPRTWFTGMLPNCRSDRVQLAVDLNHPPDGVEGIGYESACFAVAGHTAKARALVYGLPKEDRLQAATAIYNVAQEMVERGQETQAGPLMELVVEFWPNHYMALYEAGVTRYSQGDYTHARIYLSRFLELYVQHDDRADRARRMVQEMAEK